MRFARRSSRGFAYGMSKIRLATVAVAFLVFAAAMVTSGGFGVVASAPLWGIALLVAYVPVQNRKLVD